MKLVKLFQILLLSMLLFSPAVIAQEEENLFCEDNTWEEGFFKELAERAAEITRVKCDYFLLKNVLHMIVIPVLLIGSIVYAGTTWVSNKLGILKDETYVHTILAASSAIMALSFGGIGWVTSAVGIIGATGAIALGLILILGVWSAVSVARRKRRITLRNPRKVEKLLVNHEKYERNIIRNAKDVIPKLQMWRDTPGRTTDEQNEADNHISAMQEAINKIPDLGEKIRTAYNRESIDDSSKTERDSKFYRIRTGAEYTYSVTTLADAESLLSSIRSYISEIREIEKKIEKMNNETKRSRERAERIEGAPLPGRTPSVD